MARNIPIPPKRFHATAALLAACLARPAVAAEWWFVPPPATWRGQALTYVDKSSMQRRSRSSLVTARVWIVHRADQTSEHGNYRSEKHSASVECGSKSYGASRIELLDAFGGRVYRQADEPPGMKAIEAGSLQDTLSQFLCSEGKRPPRSFPVYDPARDVEPRFLQGDRESR